MQKNDRIVVCGSGGFIAGHLVARLLADGYSNILAVDIKPFNEWFQMFPQAHNRRVDLSEREPCERLLRGAFRVYNLAERMGGIGYIETHRADCMLSVLINTHLLLAARLASAERYFFASSACVYAADKQTSADAVPLKESDAWPSQPEAGYGENKLFGEQLCRYFWEDYGLETRVARYHNAYGPHGAYKGGREKAPAAICRKVIEAKLTGNPVIEIWGDGNQTRSFMFVDDCIEGTIRIMESDICEPINLGSAELVTINQLVDMVEEIAGIKLMRAYNLDAPKGVRGRSSNNTMIKERLGWEPTIKLREGLEKTFRYIYDVMTK